MRPVIEAARRSGARIVYAEGEDERILRAVQTLVDDGIAQPILLGRREVIQSRIATMGLRMRVGHNVQVLDPAQDDAVFNPMVHAYQVLVGRRGIPAEGAERLVHSRNAVAACMLLHTGQVDGAPCTTSCRSFPAHPPLAASTPSPASSCRPASCSWPTPT
jgi:malate dehydrogenase (oxaloacetate-decarboxylating)(NADP+)